MPLVTANPWRDAASYGSGLADTLGQIFLGLPKQRYEMAQEQAMQPLQMRLLQAQIGEAEAKPKMEEEMQEFRMQGQKDREDYQRQSLEERTKYDQQRIDDEKRNQDLRVQLSSLHQQFQSLQDLLKGQPTTQQATKMAEGGVADYASNLANKQGIITKNTPVTIDPNLSASVIDDVLKGRGKEGYDPTAETLQYLIKAAPILSPLLQTNKVPDTQHYMGYGRPTPNPDQVVTNGYSLMMPPGQPQQPAPQQQAVQTATNPQTGQKIKLVNGQWVPL